VPGTAAGAGAALTATPSTGSLSGRVPKEIVDKIAIPIAHDLGANTPMGIELTPRNVTAANAQHGHTQGGNTSDHEGPPEVAWAVDCSIGPDIRGGNAAGAAKGDKIAKALAEKFGVPWTGSGLASATHGGFRYQVIWRFDSAQAGNHFTHCHFGVRRV